jgi:hypothetical protein
MYCQQAIPATRHQVQVRLTVVLGAWTIGTLTNGSTATFAITVTKRSGSYATATISAGEADQHQGTTGYGNTRTRSTPMFGILKTSTTLPLM